MIHNISSLNDYQDLLSQNKPTILCFYAEWSGISVNFLSKLETWSVKHNSINFVKVDVDESEDLITHLQVESVPTTIFLNKRGESLGKLEDKDQRRLERNFERFCKSYV